MFRPLLLLSDLPANSPASRPRKFSNQSKTDLMVTSSSGSLDLLGLGRLHLVLERGLLDRLGGLGDGLVLLVAALLLLLLSVHAVGGGADARVRGAGLLGLETLDLLLRLLDVLGGREVSAAKKKGDMKRG